MPSSPATALTESCSAQASTIRDRSASACAVFRRCAHPSGLFTIVGVVPVEVLGASVTG
jgi:hypothetical protein